MVTLNIDGRDLTVPEGVTVLEAARKAGADVPTLCNEPRLDPLGQCRLCLVEVEGERRPVPSCHARVREGMVIQTETEPLQNIRRMLIELILSDIRADFNLDGDTELARMARRVGYGGENRFHVERDRTAEIGEYSDNAFIHFDPNLCVSCGRCIRVCDEVQMDHAITFAGRGFESRVATVMNRSLMDTDCVLCGGCISACPTGALVEKKARDIPLAEKHEVVRSTCAYCGVGCQVDLHVAGGVPPLSSGGARPREGRTRAPLTPGDRPRRHAGVIYEPGKCIACGRCVQITRRARDALGLTFVARGFDIRVEVPLDGTMNEGLGKLAAACVAACPTAALSCNDSRPPAGDG